jgi:dephospho-CoA kinase
MMILGLTGSIGMGKSTATRAFARLGAAVWDADAEIHRLTGPGGSAVAAVIDAFPEARGEAAGAPMVDRQALGRLVFGDPSALKRLEVILHPRVRSAERRFLAAAEGRRCRLAVLDIPLLFETGGEARCDATAVVSAPGFVQRARVLARPGMTEEKFAGILARQMPDWEKRRHAEFVIHTGLDRRESQRAARRIYDILATRRGRRWPICWPARAG